MTNALPVISSRQAIRAFERLGFSVIKGRGKGSHMVMARPEHPAILTIPDRRELAVGTLRSLLRAAGIDVATFVAALRG